MSTSTLSRREQIQETFRSSGLTLEEIGKQFGITRERVRQICVDVDREVPKPSKARPANHCPDCNLIISHTSSHCADHYLIGPRAIRWNRLSIIQALLRYNAQYGPLTAMALNPPMAIAHGHPDLAEIFYSDGNFPYTNSVREIFGTWNNALRAAGLPTRKPGQRLNPYRVGTPAKAYEDRRRGLSWREIVEKYGYKSNNSAATAVREWAKRNGRSWPI